jgi:DNA polymerase I-like protein with 3'-5' exonuclease and polymerase domains
MHTLDLETGSISGDLSDGYGLEPWRVRQGKAFITSAAVAGDDGSFVQIEMPVREQLIQLLTSLAGKEVAAHNGIFDIAFLIAAIEPNRLGRVPACVRNVRWRCTKLLAKWVLNGRKAEDSRLSYSLVNLCMVFLKNEPGLAEFIKIKQGITLDPSSPYWLERGKLDVHWTMLLYKFMWAQLHESCQRGYIIEQRALCQMANSWLMGMYADEGALDAAEMELEQRVTDGCRELGVTREIVGSPQQVGALVFGRWGFSPISQTPNGQNSTKADDLIVLAYQSGDPRLRKLLEVKQALTLLSKYIWTARDALARTGDGYLYGVPSLFGTSSGRFTYSSETLSTWKISIAQHQIPRKDKIIRRYLRPPPGTYVFETDAAAQESRIMGIWSGDEEIIRVFNSGINFHTNMASHIYGRAYEELQQAVDAEDPVAIEQRQLGKLTNLSCNFRIGGAKLAKKALTEYDTYMTEIEGRMLQKTFKTRYRGVPGYWDSIIAFAKKNGYSYTLAQRRWKVPVEMLDSGSEAWKVEGTVISHPIQGSGAEMFLAAISQVPEARLQTTMHDGIFWVVDDQAEADHIHHQLQQTPYQQLWNLPEPLSIPLVYEATKLGDNYADVK